MIDEIRLETGDLENGNSDSANWDQLEQDARLEVVRDFADTLTPDGVEVSVEIGHLPEGEMISFDETTQTVIVDQEALTNASSVKGIVDGLYEELHDPSSDGDQFGSQYLPPEGEDGVSETSDGGAEESSMLDGFVGCLGVCNVRCITYKVVGKGMNR